MSRARFLKSNEFLSYPKVFPNLQYIPVFKTICPRALSMGPWMGPGMGSAFKGGVLTTPVSPPIVPFVH